jgi:serine/threonine protein kinase
VEHISCGPFANASEEMAFRTIERTVSAQPGDGKVYVLTNLVHGISSSRQPDEIDMILIGTGGVAVIEVKHWDRSRLKTEVWDADHQADLIALKAKRVATQLRKVYTDTAFVPAHLLLTKETKSLIDNRRQYEIRGVSVYGLKDVEALVSRVLGSGSQDPKRLARLLAPRETAAAQGEIRRIGRVGELKLLSSLKERFERVYSGRDISSGDRVTLYLYDLSASTASNPELLARREFEAVQRLQKLPVLPSLVESFQPVPGYSGELFFFTLADSSAQSVVEAAGDSEWSKVARLSFAISAMRALAEIQASSQAGGEMVIHRALSPETVRVRADGQALFAGWRKARLPRAVSIAEFTSGLADSYSAPEIRTNGLAFADFRSDVYSLSKVLMDIFSDDDREGAEAKSALQAGIAEEPSARTAASELAEMLELVAQPPLPLLPPPAPQRWDEGHIIDWERGRYRIVSLLGEGGAGRTFKLEQLDGEGEEPIGTFVGKVVFNSEIGPNALQAYRKIRSIADHPGLSGVYQVAEEWRPDKLLALLKWRKGEPIDCWRGDNLRVYAELVSEDDEMTSESLLFGWAEQLCEALSVLHVQGWVHGDLSPSNILIDDKLATLIDFDLACPAGDKPLTSGTAAYASSYRRQNKPARPSDDIFALAASLFHVLTDRLPFLFEGVRRDEAGFSWEAGELERYGSLADFLDSAVNPDHTRRFESADAALNFLRTKNASKSRTPFGPVLISTQPEALRPNEVPRVKDILRAYPGSRFGNAETRGLDSSFAHDTYVETELDRLLPEAITKGEISLVILCGNAGDGKTAFLQHLAAKLGVEYLPSEQRVWNGALGNIQLKVNLDGAASWKSRSADDLLDELFEPFQHGPPELPRVHRVAVNDGRLMEWVESYRDRCGETRLTGQLAEVLGHEGEGLDPHIRLIELNLRSLVGGLDETVGNISTDFIDRLIDRLVGGERAKEVWKPCRTCSARARCSMRASADMMGASDDQDVLRQGALFRHRLTNALQAVHQRNEIHITARELKAALSYILFGTSYCEDLHKDVNLTTHVPADYAFDPSSECRQGDLLRELTRLDPALEAHARIDRYLAGKVPPDPMHGAPRYPEQSLKSARRQAYFAWTDDQIELVGGDRLSLGLNGGRRFSDFRDFPILPVNNQRRIRDALCKAYRVWRAYQK